ncbi:MMPL family transporter [Subdoligranulum sp. DSM 109015]|uniref:MMPL family transporter n=1 Tax=Gemmiger gallinarum TaxID=2779354 RepID=A0ABR9R2E7_9FIRM|nr:MMPL family transporter [Gemmiger gallinarum]MBE5037107.1 MMPL family transporter [Gemmiger gallinarum]
MKEKKPKTNGMEKIATFIVDKRNLFFLLYALALIFSVVASGWVKVENDITTYLPADTETRQGLTVMNDNFTTFGTARVMVSNISYDTAGQLKDRIAAVNGVYSVEFDDSTDHYKDASALYSVTFDGTSTDQVSLDALDGIRDALSGYDTYIDTEVGQDLSADLADEMGIILVIAAVIIVLVLTLTSRSYAEVPVLILTFGAAALLNMGTNFLCGTISFISNSVTVILQLALAIDYAIILCHRFSDEHETKDTREACIAALSKAIPEISSSSLTTISGLGALAFMHFGIGRDMATVLIKAILFSLLSVFTLMPGLLMVFSKKIDATRHRNLIPRITLLGRFDVMTRFVIPPIFVVVVIAAAVVANNCPYCYSFTDLVTPKQSESQIAHQKIKAEFGNENMVAIIVPKGNYDAERAILDELDQCPEVKSTQGLANVDAMDGYKLADAVTPRQLSELAGIDYEVAEGLYVAYAVDQDQYGSVLSGIGDYKVPLYDMFMFLQREMKNGNITLEGDIQKTLDDLFDQLNWAQVQLLSDRYSRMVVYLNLPEESDETMAFLDTIHSIIGKYYSGDTYVVGNSTNVKDLSSSFVQDNVLISVLSALFVVLILLFTFKSVGLPILLIVVIQGSIWINFSVPTLQQEPLYFLGYLIVNAIQMGANIDYAIVISSHYSDRKRQMPIQQAMIAALNEAFPTIFTSGTILAVAGALIGVMTTNPVIAAIGSCLGRGTVISIVLVLAVLPQILLVGDSIVERTSFAMKAPIDLARINRTASGNMRVSGRVRGYVNGVIDAEIKGTLNGTLNAAVTSGTTIEPAAPNYYLPANDQARAEWAQSYTEGEEL